MREFKIDKDSYTAKDSYAIYKLECKENKIEPLIPKEYVTLIYLFFQFILDLVFKGEVVKMLCGLGAIYIKGKKQKIKTDADGRINNQSPDWIKTKELWANCAECKENKQLVYNFNEHTNGIAYKIHWSHKDITTINNTYYNFIAARANNRRLKREIVDNKREYNLVLEY